jgi:hypothetical protein
MCVYIYGVDIYAYIHLYVSVYTYIYLHPMEYCGAIKKEWNPVNCSNIARMWGHCVTWDKTDIEKRTTFSYSSVEMKILSHRT